MPTIEITDSQHDRLTTLREELAEKHGTQYTSVTLPDVVAYLLDVSEQVADPQRNATFEGEHTGDTTETGPNTAADEPTAPASFPREALEARLRERNRRHSTAGAERPMALYEIAAEYDITGRSNMTKDELITAILDAAERRFTAPFAPVDIELPTAADGDEEAPGADTSNEADADTSSAAPAVNPDQAADSTEADGQLNAMLNLLETHSDKWSSADGDARYEVELPDGSVESARTKDDVRAVLFKHY